MTHSLPVFTMAQIQKALLGCSAYLDRLSPWLRVNQHESILGIVDQGFCSRAFFVTDFGGMDANTNRQYKLVGHYIPLI